MRVTAARALRAASAVLVVLGLGAGSARAASQEAVLAAFDRYRSITVEEMTPMEMAGNRPALKLADKNAGILLYLVGPEGSVEDILLMISVTRDNGQEVARAVAAMVATAVDDADAADWVVAAMSRKDAAGEAAGEAAFGDWKTKLSVPTQGMFSIAVTGPPN